MLLSAILIFSLAAVPLFGGRLRSLGEVSFYRPTLMLVALVMQILVIEVVPNLPTLVTTGGHLVSYGLAGAFLYLNRHISGLWLIGLGGAANFAAIAANGGYMPASPSALKVAELPLEAGTEGFVNSVALAHPRLLILGDIFAIPGSWPLSNVFSVGDVCIALGGAIAIHRICGSRLAWTGRRNRQAKKAP